MNKQQRKVERRKANTDVWLDQQERIHFRWGWWSLLVFLSLGLLLESLYWMQVGWYVDSESETRRLMWTLAHVHGTLLGIVHLAFALTLSILKPDSREKCAKASLCLRGAGVLLPGGFFLGGAWVYGGDPGLGILLVPVGALLLFFAVLFSALASLAVTAVEPVEDATVTEVPESTEESDSTENEARANLSKKPKRRRKKK